MITMNSAASIHSSIANTITVSSAHLSGNILSDELSDDSSSSDSAFDTPDLMDTTISDEITSHLAAAGLFYLIKYKFNLPMYLI